MQTSQLFEQPRYLLYASVFGGIVSMRFVEGMSVKQRLTSIVSGAITAHYLAPVIAFLFSGGEYEETIGFLIGLFGLSICSAIFRTIEESDIWGIIEKRLGGSAK